MNPHATLKTKLHQALLHRIDTQIESLNNAIQSIHESKSNETKSSAGDKFETGRAMLHLEQDQLEAQLKNASESQLLLNTLKGKPSTDKISIGSLITTNKGTYYISIGVGKFILEDQTFLVISVSSPIGKLFVGKVVGDVVLFNGKRIEVLGVA